MSRARTLTNLIADCRQRADMVNSTFVTDAEITEWLNQELAEVWGLIVLNETHPHFRSSTSYSVTVGNNLQALPASFWRAQEVTATINGITGTITSFMPMERARLSNQGVAGWGMPTRARIQGSNIEFQPVLEAFTATLYFTPVQPRLSAGSDTFDGFNGYEMAAIHGTVAQMLAKEESDSTFSERQKERWIKIIEAIANSRDGNQPDRVQDVEAVNADWWVF